MLTNISVNAEEIKSDNSHWYIGIKPGFTELEGQSGGILSAGLDAGYRNNKYLSTEIQIMSTFPEEETPFFKTFNIDTFSVFAALRTNTKYKLKAKVGLTRIKGAGVNDTKVSHGLGVGFPRYGGLVEIEYTKLGSGFGFFNIGIVYFY